MRSDEVEALEIARELARTPRMNAVNTRFAEVLAAFPDDLDEHEKDRKFRLECLAASVGSGLLRGEDISEQEHAEWMALLGKPGHLVPAAGNARRS